MKLLRTLSTSRLLLLMLALAAVIAILGAVAVAARGSGGSTPPTHPLSVALHDSLGGAQPNGITARVTFTNKLLPSGALTGQVGSALMSGASGRLWATDDGRGRLELQSDAGDVQIVWNRGFVTVFDASSNTVYRATLPKQVGAKDNHEATPSVPTVAEIDRFLTGFSAHVDLSNAEPVNVGGRPAYDVRVLPKRDGGLVGAVELAWDAARPVPLRIGVYAKGGSSPVLELAVDDISYAAVPASDVDVAPPVSAKTVDLGGLTHGGGHDAAKPRARGLAAAKAAAGFRVVAPARLAGLPREDARLVGHGESPSLVAVYGQGLGSVVVVERTAHGGAAGSLGALPKVSLDRVSGHELATQLGTVLEWNRSGVSFVLAGSVPTATAEAAARALQ